MGTRDLQGSGTTLHKATMAGTCDFAAVQTHSTRTPRVSPGVHRGLVGAGLSAVVKVPLWGVSVAGEAVHGGGWRDAGSLRTCHSVFL